MNMLKTLQEKLIAIYHIIMDNNYIVYIATAKNIRNVIHCTNGCCIVSKERPETPYFLQAVCEYTTNVLNNNDNLNYPWNECSKKLPEKQGEYLVATFNISKSDHFIYEICRYCPDFGWEYCKYNLDFSRKDVYYWTEIPVLNKKTLI